MRYATVHSSLAVTLAMHLFDIDIACRHKTSVTHPLLAMLLDSQSRPSYRPSPDVAHVLWIYLHGMCAYFRTASWMTLHICYTIS